METKRNLLSEIRKKNPDWKPQNKTTLSDEPEWTTLAEFGMYFGWTALKEVLNNELTAEAFNELLFGARRMNAARRYNKFQDMTIAFAATQSKKNQSVYKKHLEELRK